MHCENDFFESNFKDDTQNPVFQLFWGKAKIHYASSCYYFIKGEKLQELIHQFKYKGKKKLAIFFAKLMYEQIKNSNLYREVDAICYVPSSKAKILKRGYNQAEELAICLGKQMDVPVFRNALIKNKNVQSQTDKNVFERYENSKHIFECSSKIKLDQNHKHLLLVDDVVTTGATLEACANALLRTHPVKVSILTLAYRNI